MLQHKQFILVMEPSFKLALTQVLPTYTSQEIDEKVKALEDILCLEIAASMVTHPAYARRDRFYISTNAIRKELKQYECKKHGIKKTRVYDLIQSVCPVLIEDKTFDTLSGVMGHKVLASLSGNVIFLKHSNAELARSLSYEYEEKYGMGSTNYECLTEEFEEIDDRKMTSMIDKCRAEVRLYQSHKMIDRLYRDYFNNPADYELIRINLASLRAYYEYHKGPGREKFKGKTIREQINQNLAIIPIMVEIGDYFKNLFPDKHTGKNPDYTDYGWLPVKSSKSKFGRTYYKSPLAMLDPQTMNRKLRSVALGDNTTYDYDMRSFAATWMYGEVNKLVEDAENKFPIAFRIASGDRAELFDELRAEVFGDRIQTKEAMQTIYDSHADRLFFDGDMLINSIKTPKVDDDGNETGQYSRTTDLHVSKEKANKILKRCFQAISFGAKANTNTWCVEKVNTTTGKKKLSFRTTAFVELFYDDKILATKFLSDQIVRHYLHEINQITELLLEHNAAAIDYLKDDKDFIYANGKWKNSNVMAYLYQHAEWDVMDSVRSLIEYYNDQYKVDVFVIASIHDGVVLNKADIELLDFIHENIRSYYGNPYYTLVGVPMNGYKNDHFALKQISEHQARMAEQENKAHGYVSPYVTVAEKSQREIEQEQIDLVEQSMMDFFAYQEELEKEDEEPKSKLVAISLEDQLAEIYGD